MVFNTCTYYCIGMVFLGYRYIYPVVWLPPVSDFWRKFINYDRWL